jgi:membrane protease YdiL (CAAX protease family)
MPAICEEWFFRGFMLRSLLRSQSALAAIFTSAIVFGLFHVLSNSVVAFDRLIPTTLLGFVLGYLALKSGSILPGIMLHALHNGIVAFLAYFQPQLSGFSWFPAESQPIPYWWSLIALVPASIAFVIVFRAQRPNVR